jgi:hypothetical protein
MATPAVSGALAIVIQYLIEARHQLPKPPPISPSLLRAIIIHSARYTSPRAYEGYGLPNLTQVLLLPAHFATNGLRLLSGRISSGTEIVMNVTVVGSGSPLTVTLAWMDIPIGGLLDDYINPVILDLDLYIVPPTGSFIYGHMRGEEDPFATSEKIRIDAPAAGLYEIHIVANPSISAANVNFSLVVTGPFAHLDFDTNPANLSTNRSQRSWRVCPTLATGLNCQVQVTELHADDESEIRLNARTFAHFHIAVPSGSSTITVVTDFRTTDPGTLRVLVNKDNKHKLSLARFLVGNRPKSQRWELNPADFNGEIYFSAYNDFYGRLDLSVTWEETAGLSAWIVPLIIGITFLLGGAGYVIYRCVRGKRKARQERLARDQVDL